MSNSTPGFIDPYRMAKSGQTLVDKVELASLSRASKLSDSGKGEVNYQLEFSIDAENYCVINGKLDTILTVRCQRCLKEFQEKVASEFVVSPVRNDEEAKALPEFYEAVYIADNKIYPVEMIEDELILAVPIVPLHDLGDINCVEITATAEQNEEKVTTNPFQVLQNLNVNKKSRQAED